MMHAVRAEKPDAMCTTVPPAKSSAPMPLRKPFSNPDGVLLADQIQWAGNKITISSSGIRGAEKSITNRVVDHGRPQEDKYNPRSEGNAFYYSTRNDGWSYCLYNIIISIISINTSLGSAYCEGELIECVDAVRYGGSVIWVRPAANVTALKAFTMTRNIAERLLSDE